jgi:hypothetical protein
MHAVNGKNNSISILIHIPFVCSIYTYMYFISVTCRFTLAPYSCVRACVRASERASEALNAFALSYVGYIITQLFSQSTADIFQFSAMPESIFQVLGGSEKSRLFMVCMFPCLHVARDRTTRACRHVVTTTTTTKTAAFSSPS